MNYAGMQNRDLHYLMTQMISLLLDPDPSICDYRTKSPFCMKKCTNIPNMISHSRTEHFSYVVCKKQCLGV